MKIKTNYGPTSKGQVNYKKLVEQIQRYLKGEPTIKKDEH